LPLRNQRGSAKTVFTIANALFQAGMHAYGAIKGHHGGLGYLGGIWSAITTLADWIARVLNWIDERLDWFIKRTMFWLLSKIHEFWKERIKKELEKILVKYEDLKAFYTEIRARLLFALQWTLATLFPKTWKDIQMMFAMLRDLAAFTYAIAPTVAKAFYDVINYIDAKINEINNYISEKINDAIRPILTEIDKVWGNIDTIFHDHLYPMHEAMNRLERDLHKVITPEGKVREEFAEESGNVWARVWIGKIRAAVKGIEVPYKPPSMPVGEIAEILEKLCPDEVEKMPEEELEMYKYLEEISERTEWV